MGGKAQASLSTARRLCGFYVAIQMPRTATRPARRFSVINCRRAVLALGLHQWCSRTFRSIQDVDVLPNVLGGGLNVTYLDFGLKIFRINEESSRRGLGLEFTQQPQPHFESISAINVLTPVRLPAGRRRLPARPLLIGSVPCVYRKLDSARREAETR